MDAKSNPKRFQALALLKPGIERRCHSCNEYLPRHQSRCMRCAAAYPRLRWRLLWQVPVLVAAAVWMVVHALLLLE